MKVITVPCITCGILFAILVSAYAQSKTNFPSPISTSITITNQVPQKIAIDLSGNLQQPTPKANMGLEWAKALAPALAALIAVIGVAVTAWITMRRGRLDARYTYASKIFAFRLRQLQEFYAPALLLIEQSRSVYEKMLWTIKHERIDIPLDGFRLLDHIHLLRKDKKTGPLIERVLDIGKQLTNLISRKSGLMEGGVAPTYIEYQAHFGILQAASEQELSAEQKEGWHEFGYYPRMLNREIREGYKVVLGHVENYLASGDQTISELLKQRTIELDKYRRQLIANLTYYEIHAKTYAEQFDKFDLSRIRQRFLDAMRVSVPLSNEIQAALTSQLDDGKKIKGEILDAGCGAGRDTYEFIKQGYAVTAIDPSPALLRFCRRKIRDAEKNKETEQAAKASHTHEMTFDELSFRNEFEGVWAAASLLHVPPQQMKDTLKTLFRALKPDGVLFFSLKYGAGEHERDARFYTYYGRQEIRNLLQYISEAQEIAIWLTDVSGNNLSEDQQAAAWKDELSGRYDRSLWLNILVRKTLK